MQQKTKTAPRWIVLLLGAVLALTAFHFAAAASEDPLVVIFSKEGCPDCRRLDELLAGLSSQHPQLTIDRYEIGAPGAQELLSRLAFAYGVLDTDYPIVFVGDKAFVGVSRAKEIAVRTAVLDCVAHDCPSPLSRLSETSLSWDHVVIALGIGMFLLLLLFPRQP